MNKYIIVTTLCYKEDVAKRIVDRILEKNLAAGAQISKTHSKYWWNNTFEECDEYKIEFITKYSLYKKI